MSLLFYVRSLILSHIKTLYMSLILKYRSIYYLNTCYYVLYEILFIFLLSKLRCANVKENIHRAFYFIILTECPRISLRQSNGSQIVYSANLKK